jgi:hypothetical protein
MIYDISKAWKWHKSAQIKGITVASLSHHWSSTVSSHSHHCLITVFVKRSCVTKQTPKALQKVKIWSMTSQNIDNNNKKLNSKESKSEASRLHHCSITVSSLSHQCLIIVFGSRSCFTTRSITTLSRHGKRKRIINDVSKPCKWH